MFFYADCRLFLNKPLRVLQRKETIRFTRVWSNSSFSCSCGDGRFSVLGGRKDLIHLHYIHTQNTQIWCSFVALLLCSVVLFVFVDKENKKLQIELCRLSSCSAGGAFWGLPIWLSGAVFRQSFETDFGSCFNRRCLFVFYKKNWNPCLVWLWLEWP